MKKALMFFWCLTIFFSMSACRQNKMDFESSISSDVYQNESLIVTEQQSDTFSNTNSDITSSIKDTTTNSTNSSQPTVNSDPVDSSDTTANTSTDNSYTDIVCNAVFSFQKVGFSIKGSNTMLFVTIPQEWELQKSENGYSILKNSQTIGTITATIKATSTQTSVNVFENGITTNDIKVTHIIDRIGSANTPSYVRTLCYNYDDESGTNKSVVITIPYQEIDSSAAYKMITEANKAISATGNNMGLLQIQDNRNKILILGNSFINSSRIGAILQSMCGNEVMVEAHSRGYAHVGTYTGDAAMMQNIRSGNYSAVFICGLYDQEAVSDLQDIIDVCKESETKLAIFPAHNENRQKIDNAASLYQDTIILDWKAEIDSLISTGIDVSNFCIPDAHKHSTPLAGYVGAHMIYRAVFNKIPQTIQFSDLTQSQINLLGDYVTTGSITLVDINSSYVIEE